MHKRPPDNAGAEERREQGRREREGDSKGARARDFIPAASCPETYKAELARLSMIFRGASSRITAESTLWILPREVCPGSLVNTETNGLC